MRRTRDVSHALPYKGAKRVGALRTLSPIFQALIKSPGAAAADGEMLEAAQRLRKESERLTGELVSILEINDVGEAVKARVGEVVSTCVASEWLASGGDLDMEPYHPVWGYVADSDVGLDLVGYDLSDPFDALDLRLTMVEAMTQIVSRLRQTYMMRQSESVLFPRVMASIVRVAASGVEAIVGADASSAKRLAALCALIPQCAGLFCAHWDRVARRKVVELSAMSEVDRLGVYGAHPDGFSVDEIFEGYRSDFRGLIESISRFRFDSSQEPIVSMIEGV